LGQLEFGVYDDYENVPASTLERYYGVDGDVMQRIPGHTGAGHLVDEDFEDFDDSPADDDDADWVDMHTTREAMAEVDLNTYEEPVIVPAHNSPFNDSEMQAFGLTLANYEASGHLPPGYGMLPDEWQDGLYPTFQALQTGRRGSKRLEIGLPDMVWRPRSELWVRALDIMMKIKNLQEFGG